MAVQNPLTYNDLLKKFKVEENKAYQYNTVTFTGIQNAPSITRDSVNALIIPNRYFKVMGPVEYMPGREYIKINIFEKGRNNRVDDDTSQFGLTQRMDFGDDGLTEYEPPGGGNKRRRTKKSKKSKRRRSFK
jgi:hypothetical protein